MMTRLILIVFTLSAYGLKTQGQCTVYQDEKGEVLTTCDYYASTNRSLTPTHTRETYLGSPFLSFPVWQEGKIQLDKQGKELDCELAYNLVTSEVMCRFAGDSTVKLIIPEVFTINGSRFVRQLIKLPGVKYTNYFTPLSSGKTKLLRSLTGKLEGHYGYGDKREIKGIYRTITKYYLQKEDTQPELIELTKKSLLDALADQAKALDATIPSGQLTTNDIINVIDKYDSLVAVELKSQVQLTKEELFRQKLQSRIIYPGWVGKQGIYGRVYAGFDVDSQGAIKNIVILSPDNIGFGFTSEVKNALETLAPVDPSFSGNYALPVAFTYTNQKEASGPHVPINRLPDDRLAGRYMLEEIVVPYVVTTSIAASREVWGYYK